MASIGAFVNKSKRLWVASLLRYLEENERTPGWVATKAGVARSQVGRIVSGDSEPTLDTMERISKALGVSVVEWSRPAGASGDGASEPSPLSADFARNPTGADVAAVVSELLAVSPERRAIAMAILFDDDSLAPESVDLSAASRTLSKPG